MKAEDFFTGLESYSNPEDLLRAVKAYLEARVRLREARKRGRIPIPSTQTVPMDVLERNLCEAKRKLMPFIKVLIPDEEEGE
jgi:hypothetical protein